MLHGYKVNKFYFTFSDAERLFYIYEIVFFFKKGFRRLRDFVVTQHPLVGTIKDFWQMIWDHNVQTIVLLSSLDDIVSFAFELKLK